MKRFQPVLLACACAAALSTGSAVGAAPAAQFSSADISEISVSYDYLTNNFYKNVSPQVVLNAVRSDLLATLRGAGVARATLPALRHKQPCRRQRPRDR